MPHTLNYIIEKINKQVKYYLKQIKKNAIPLPIHCPICNETNCLTWYGQYTRQLISLQTIYKIPIRRVHCNACGHTPALIPDFILKYHHYAKEIIKYSLNLIKKKIPYAKISGRLYQNQDPNSTMIAIQTLILWKKEFENLRL